MATATLTIQLEGSLDDNGNVRLEEFLEELQAIKTALKQTERIVVGQQNTVYYRVIELTHSSPSTVRIEAVAHRKENQHVPRRVVRRFATSLRMIQRRHRAPRDFDLEALEAFKNISNPLSKNLRKITITEDEKRTKAAINQEYEDALRRIIGYDQKERGSMMGKMEALNVHLNTNTFIIFPTVGPKKVTCKFRGDLRQTVLKYAGSYVRADGVIISKSQSKFPHAMEVFKLEEFPAEEATKLSDIRGMAPNATDGIRAEEFTRKLRDEEW
jgi:hypothetical protein